MDMPNIPAPSTRAFPTHTVETAPEASRPLLASVRSANGFLPAAVARTAESPAVLLQELALFKAFAATSLSALEREVVTMLVARTHDCGLCVAMHSAILARTGASPERIEALRAGTPLGEERLDALSAFAASVIERRGDVAPDVWARFLAAGFTRAQALEVVLGVAVYTLSTFANRLVEAPIDAPLLPYARAEGTAE